MSPVYDTDGYLDLSVYGDVDPDDAVSSEVLARLHAAFDAPIPEMPTDAEWTSLVGDALVGADDAPFDLALDDADADGSGDEVDASPAGPFAVDGELAPTSGSADPAGDEVEADDDAGAEGAFAVDALVPEEGIEADVASTDLWAADPFDDGVVVEADDPGDPGDPGSADDLDL